MEIKKVEQSDLMACAKEMSEAFKVEPWKENWTVEQAYRRFDEIMSAKNALGYCMYDHEQVICTVVGRVMTYLDYKEYNIDDFSVLPSYQGQGIGSKMIEYIRSDLKGVEYFTLTTHADYPSVSFYTKNGIELSKEIVFMNGKVKKEG